ncbi:hypothetical protein PIB30_031538, partial [Stylosanthes scabra]|nr:hypothetical protein [Stylosanthes scabra]
PPTPPFKPPDATFSSRCVASSLHVKDPSLPPSFPSRPPPPLSLLLSALSQIVCSTARPKGKKGKKNGITQLSIELSLFSPKATRNPSLLITQNLPVQPPSSPSLPPRFRRPFSSQVGASVLVACFNEVENLEMLLNFQRILNGEEFHVT